MTTYNSAKYGNVESGGVENKLIIEIPVTNTEKSSSFIYEHNIHL